MKSIIVLLGFFTLWTLSNHFVENQDATLVGEGIISTGQSLSQTVSPDGDEMYFARFSDDGTWSIFHSRWENGIWMEPELAPFSSPYIDADPYFSADGNKIFFLSNRPVGQGEEPPEFFDIWYTEKTEKGWAEPVFAKDINTKEYGEGFMSLTHSGDIVFTSNRPDALNQHPIFIAENNGTNFETPKPLGLEVNIEIIPNPMVARDGSYIIFDNKEDEETESSDLFIAFKKEDEWTKPVNLGPKVNSDLSESAPFVTSDGRHLFFARSKPTDDIFTSNIYQIAFKPVLEKAREKAGVK